MVPIEGNKFCDVDIPQHSFYFDNMTTIECYNLCVKKGCKVVTLTGSVDNPHCQVLEKCDHIVDADERSLTFTIYNPYAPYLPTKSRRCRPQNSDSEERDGDDTKFTEQKENTNSDTTGGSSTEQSTDSIKPEVKSTEGIIDPDTTGEIGPKENTDSHEDESITDTNGDGTIRGGENTPPSDKDKNTYPNDAKGNKDSNKSRESMVGRNTDSRKDKRFIKQEDKQTAGDERKENQKPKQVDRRYSNLNSTEIISDHQMDVDVMHVLYTPITGTNCVVVGILIHNPKHQTIKRLSETKRFVVHYEETFPFISPASQTHFVFML